MKLSSGICRIPDMLKLDVPVGLAVDGSASNDGSNLLEELRVAFLLHRLNSSSHAPSGYDILKITTNGSAKILGRNDIGSLAVGKAGDMFLIRRDRLDLIENGHLVNIDEEKFISEGRKSVTDYLSRS